MNSSIIRQFVQFTGVGIVATAVQFAILVVAVEGFHANAVFASSLGFALSALCNYWLNYHFTFRSRNAHVIAASRFALVAMCGLLINAAVMAGLIHLLHWRYLLAQLAAALPVLTWNFSVNRLWSFAADPPGCGDTSQVGAP